MTKYIILRRLDDEVLSEGGPGAWREYAAADSSSPERALRSLDDGVVDGVYVAVPMRSWKHIPVKTEQTTKVTIG